MKRLIFISLMLIVFISLNAITKHERYFENTDYELNVYYIQGDNPGKTLMIIGGIQGDEAGGYMSADLYVDTKLEQGNLIIVPRANLPTIMNNKRQITKDMNRRFDEKKSGIYEDEVVEILKDLINKSDILLNLHEGGGYYRETWVDNMQNPMKFGQCIIGDADSYYSVKRNENIELGNIARTICEKANQFIPEEKYKFRFNNHDTVSNDSKHLEQRKSATYYSLTQAGIPAFGVEVSKQLPSLSLKVKHHTVIINEFLKYLDIIPQYPSIFIEDPSYDFAIFIVNGEKKIIERGETLYVPQDAEVEFHYLEGNYQRGYLIDLEGYGTTNDQGKSFKVSANTGVKIRKDAFDLGTIPVVVGKEPVIEPYKGLEIMVNNQTFTLEPDQDLKIQKNDQIKISRFLNESMPLEANLLGWANPKCTANDLGYSVKIDDRLLKKYSPDDGTTWIIEILLNKKSISKHKLIITEPEVPKLQAKLNYFRNNKEYTAEENSIIECQEGDRIYFNKVTFPDGQRPNVKINLAGFISDPRKDGDDRGVEFVVSRSRFYNKFQIEENVFEIQINQNEKRLSTFYLKIRN